MATHTHRASVLARETLCDKFHVAMKPTSNTTNAFTQSEKDNPPVSPKNKYKKNNEKSGKEIVNQVNSMRQVLGGVNV